MTIIGSPRFEALLQGVTVKVVSGDGFPWSNVHPVLAVDRRVRSFLPCFVLEKKLFDGSAKILASLVTFATPIGLQEKARKRYMDKDIHLTSNPTKPTFVE